MRLGRSAALTAAVAVAFADSSIVVLALPELYGRFNTTIEGVSWVVTAYNAAVAVTALLLLLLVHRLSSTVLLGAGLGLFLAASIACAAAQSLAFLIGARTVQGVGAALLLVGALPVLGRARWTAAGTFGLALGPALGGVLTQAFDWRAIFVAQAPVAALGLVGLDMREPFNANGARSDPALAAVRDRLFGAIAATITRASRPAFLLCAGFAALALIVAAAFRRRIA